MIDSFMFFVRSAMKRIARLVMISLAVAGCISPLFARNRPSVITVSHAQTVTGTVHAVNGMLISILDGNVTIDATGAKIVSGRDASSIDAIRPGVRIHAALHLTHPIADNGALRAQIIAVENPPEGSLTGAVQTVDVAGSRFTLLGETILVTPQTSFVGSTTHPESLELSNLKAGDPVAVDVDSTAAGLTAVRVLILHMTPRPGVHFSGTVKSIASEQWTITDPSGKDLTVKITPETKIGGSPAVGDRVEVFGHFDSSNQFVAISIVKAVPRPTMFRGFVKTIGATEWTLADASGKEIVVKINSDTKIAGSPIVGDLVEVVAHVDASGTYVALSISKASTPPIPIVVIGTVKTIGEQEWTLTDLSGKTFTLKITRETRIDRSIAVGDQVSATVTRDSSGALTALAIGKFSGPLPPSDFVKFEGVVRNIEGDVWTIDTTKVRTSSRTLFIGHPAIGDRVRVVGVKSHDGSILAISIEKL